MRNHSDGRKKYCKFDEKLKREFRRKDKTYRPSRSEESRSVMPRRKSPKEQAFFEFLEGIGIGEFCNELSREGIVNEEDFRKYIQKEDTKVEIMKIIGKR